MSASAGYAQLDRLLHSLAFRGLEIQKVLADLEDTVYARAVAEIAVDRPVFITSPPRRHHLAASVGERLPRLRLHTYRNMSFDTSDQHEERASTSPIAASRMVRA